MRQTVFLGGNLMALHYNPKYAGSERFVVRIRHDKCILRSHILFPLEITARTQILMIKENRHTKQPLLRCHPQCQWSSYQIRKIAGCACAGNAGKVFPHRRLQRKPLVSDPGMHHGTCVTHVP